MLSSKPLKIMLLNFHQSINEVLTLLSSIGYEAFKVDFIILFLMIDKKITKCVIKFHMQSVYNLKISPIK